MNAEPQTVRRWVPPYQQRVLDEKLELDGRTARLHAFIEDNPAFTGLPAAEQTRLKRQRAVQCVLSSILEDRIANFPAAEQ